MITIGKETANKNLGVACFSFKKIKVPYSFCSKTLILLRRQKKFLEDGHSVINCLGLKEMD
jgi:hypothetical protein